MDIDKCIKERRSTRSFLKKDISFEQVSEILDAARYAPSSGNLQNWSFIIVKDKENKEKLAKACAGQYFLIDAPVLIIVCSNLERLKEAYGNRGEALYSIQNCAAAIQNMLLKAHDLELATCWVSAFDEENVKRLFKIEDDTRPQAVVAIGYAEESEREAKRFPLKSMVFFEEWNNKKRDTGLWPISKYIKKR